MKTRARVQNHRRHGKTARKRNKKSTRRGGASFRQRIGDRFRRFTKTGRDAIEARDNKKIVEMQEKFDKLDKEDFNQIDRINTPEKLQNKLNKYKNEQANNQANERRRLKREGLESQRWKDTKKNYKDFETKGFENYNQARNYSRDQIGKASTYMNNGYTDLKNRFYPPPMDAGQAACYQTCNIKEQANNEVSQEKINIRNAGREQDMTNITERVNEMNEKNRKMDEKVITDDFDAVMAKAEAKAAAKAGMNINKVDNSDVDSDVDSDGVIFHEAKEGLEQASPAPASRWWGGGSRSRKPRRKGKSCRRR